MQYLHLIYMKARKINRLEFTEVWNIYLFICKSYCVSIGIFYLLFNLSVWWCSYTCKFPAEKFLKKASWKGMIISLCCFYNAIICNMNYIFIESKVIIPSLRCLPSKIQQRETAKEWKGKVNRKYMRVLALTVVRCEKYRLSQIHKDEHTDNDKKIT